MENELLIYEMVKFIPKGKVLTYSELAKLTQIKSPRVVGNILHKNIDEKNIPCHRVVNIEGKLARNYAFGGEINQKKRLICEGIILDKKRVELEKYLWRPSKIFQQYFILLKKFGQPGPWPWFGQDQAHNKEEIVIGAILTQNTNWHNVMKAIRNLEREKLCSIDGIDKIGSQNIGKLKELVKPSGYYNQKAERLYLFANWIKSQYNGLDSFFKLDLDSARKALLEQKGIGKETADTILLYGGRYPIFVIDAYTKRFLSRIGIGSSYDYDEAQSYFMKNLPKNISLYQDFHALIVQWAKTK